MTMTMTSNYDALRDYLKAQTRADFVLTFAEIEDLIDDALLRVVGARARAGGEEAAARGLHRRRLPRHPHRGRQGRAVPAPALKKHLSSFRGASPCERARNP